MWISAKRWLCMYSADLNSYYRQGHDHGRLLEVHENMMISIVITSLKNFFVKINSNDYLLKVTMIFVLAESIFNSYEK